MVTLTKRIKDGWLHEQAIVTPSSSAVDRWRQPVEAFGELKSIEQWEQDPRAVVNAVTILTRIRNGWNPEQALIAPAATPRAVGRPVARLYQGKSIAEWLQDPRCQVSRFTLERNLRAHMPLEEALVFKKRRSSPPPPSRVVDCQHEVVDLLRQGGELWHYDAEGHRRTSILHRQERIEVDPQLFTELRNSNVIRKVYESECLQQYRLSQEKRLLGAGHYAS
jgi:hypothetical protein